MKKKIKLEESSSLRIKLKDTCILKPSPKQYLKFISSGSWMLNLALTNNIDYGYPIGRVINGIGSYSTGKCIKNSYVLTENGMIKIDNLLKKEGLYEYNIKVASFKNEIKDTSFIYKEKVNKTIKIKTKFGFEIEGTEEHPIMIFDSTNHIFKMRKLKNINEDDWVVIQKGMNFFPKNEYTFTSSELNYYSNSVHANLWEAPEKMTKELARLIGYFVADGNFVNNSICISNTKKYILNDIQFITKTLNLPYGGNRYISGIEFKTFLHNLFNNPEHFRAKHKFVPDCILQSTKEHQAEFIKALMDCDSSYDNKTDFEYSTASKKLASQIQLMFLNFGIFSSKKFKKVKTYPDNVYYRITIFSMEYKKYKSEIGSLKYKFNYSPTKTMGVIPNYLIKIWKHVDKIRKENKVSKNGVMVGKGRFPQYSPSRGVKTKNASYTNIQNFINLYSDYTDVSEYSEIMNYHFSKVTKIETIHKETFVYDFTIPDNHLFWSNGMISHNTLLLCEAINSVWYDYHLKQGKKVKIYYDEPEDAFDLDLAKQFKMPLENIVGLRERLPTWEKTKNDFKASKTIENVYTNIKNIVEEESSKYDVILYGLDSLDSVSDSREIKHIDKKGVGAQDYGAGKPSVLSQMFRTCIQSVNQSNIIFFILSQVRSNIGITFGPKLNRSGGHALDHYASQIFWLYEKDKITDKNGINQGIEVEVNVDKNKTGSRYNKVRFNILHGYGIDNYGSAVNFLWDNKVFDISGAYINWGEKKYYRNQLIEKAANEPETAQQLKEMLQNHWNEMIEEAAIKRPPKWGN